MRSEVDQAARRAAVTTYDRNLVIVAAAGTGKTSLLIERILNQVIEQDLPAGEFAAMTFTERAASELVRRLERGLERLLDRARDENLDADEGNEADRAYAHLRNRLDPSELSARAARFRGELPNASIGTIHAFCARLLRAHPLESGLDPGFQIDEGPPLATFREEVWSEFLASADGPEGPRGDEWRRVLRVLELRELESLALRLGDFSIPSLDPLPDSAPVLRPRIDALLVALDAAVEEPDRAGPESFLSTAARLLRALRERGSAAFDEELARAIYQPARGEPRGLLDRSPPSAKALPAATRCAKQIHRFLEHLTRVDDPLLGMALDLVGPCARAMREGARRRGLIPFDGLLCLARDLLRDHPDVRRRISQRYQVILVDEFQDTDPLQYEIVLHLAEASSVGEGQDPYANELAKGKLFIVGDPKQSIYHFRNADIAAYNRAIAHIVDDSGGEKLELTTNWRTPPEIIAPLNDLFTWLLDPATSETAELDPPYAPMSSGREPAPQGSPPLIEVWTVGSEPARSADEARALEAGGIAAWLAEGYGHDRLAYGDVVILFRALTSVELYTNALEERGIPFSVDSRQAPLDSPTGQQLQAILRAVANPNDEPAVLGFLRSPLGAVSDTELLRYAESGGRSWSHRDASPDAARFPNLARAFAWLAAWYERSLRQPTPEWLCSLLDESPLLALHGATADGSARVEHLQRLVERLADIARRTPGCTPASLLPWMERADLLPTEIRAIPGHVRLMSVHGAKGLEFPIVILPDLARGALEGSPNRGSTSELAWIQSASTIAVCAGPWQSSSWLRREWEEERHSLAESKRLLYVACTRVRERLVLVHAPRRRGARRDRGRWIDALEAWAYPAEGLDRASELAGAGVSHRLVIPAPAVGVPGHSDEPRDWVGPVERARKAAAMGREALRAGIRSPSALPEEDRIAPQREASGAGAGRGELARRVGTAIHEALERWDFEDTDALRADLEAAVVRACRAAAGELEAVRREAFSVLEVLLASGIPAHLAGCEILGRELPLLFEDSTGQAWSGSLDLLYRDPDGRLVIADYKTDRSPDPERHAAQLAVYAEGVARALPDEGDKGDERPPVRELIFVRTGERVRVE